MKKLTVVHFGPNGARIYVGPAAAKMASDPNSIVNPILPKKVPLHLWVKDGKAIKVVNQPIPHKPSLIHKRSLGAGALIGLLLGLLTHLFF